MTTQATCPRCQQVSCHLHQNHWYLVRDLSISGQTVFFEGESTPIKCRTCEKPLARHSILFDRRKQTNRFAEFVQQVIHSDIHNVAVQNDLTDEEVWKGRVAS